MDFGLFSNQKKNINGEMLVYQPKRETFEYFQRRMNTRWHHYAIVTDCLARETKTNPSILGPTSQRVRIVGWRHLGFAKSPVGTTL